MKLGNAAVNRPNYYPAQHRTELVGQWRFTAIGVAFLGLLGCGSVLGALYYDSLAIVAAATLAISIVFGWTSLWGLYDTYRYVRIVPYFDRRVGNIDTYTAGFELARYCGKLDEIAAAGGQTVVSAFGFNDDLLGETLVWHSPADGLQTVGALLEAVAAQPDEFDDQISVVSDLERLANALRQANEQGICFCLLLLHGYGTSGHEWDVRKGSAF